LDNKTKFQTAVHESGHAFMFIYLGHAFSTVTVLHSEKRNYFGRISGGSPTIKDSELQKFIRHTIPKDEDIVVKNKIYNIIKIFLAGYEAEKIFKVYSPDMDNEFHSYDYKKAWTLAQAISVRNTGTNTKEVLDRFRIESRSVLLENQSILKRIVNELMKFEKLNYDVLKDWSFSQ